MHVENGTYSYAMSILKSNNGDPSSCNRYTFAYQNAKAGEGHFIHTYKCDGNPLPSFEGEPKLVQIPDNMDEFADMLWESLNEDNKVSLFVRYIDIETGKYEIKNYQQESLKIKLSVLGKLYSQNGMPHGIVPTESLP